jgi:large conductance mechanosensitive channel
MIEEFKKFILRGNVIDLAVGVIIGAAFNKIVSSLVTDIITPPLGLMLGKVQFSNFYISLTGEKFESLSAAQAAGAPVLTYGAFLDALITFLITALAVFLIVKSINKFHEKTRVKEEKAPDTKKCPHCLSKVSIKATKCAFCTSDLKTN